MGRSISELRAQLVAGEPLTPDERAELAQYDALADRLIDGLRQTLPPDEQTRAETGDESERFIAAILSDLDTHDDVSPFWRQRIHEMVIILRLQADRLAERTGLTRRVGKQRARAGTKSGAARRKKAEAFLRTIAETKARPPMLTGDTEVARRYLKDTDPDWAASEEADRKQKVDKVTHRIRDARKLTGA